MSRNSKEKGIIGENIACEYINNKGFSLILRNYRKKWGEIDIIAEKDKKIHFFEVKSITVKSFNSKLIHFPEENVHNLKMSHIKRVVETYFSENYKGLDVPFAFHVICVYLNFGNKLARVKMIENIIL